MDRETEPLATVGHDGATEREVSQTVVEAIARVEEVDPLDLEPLYRHVDADALDTLFSAPNDGLRVSFPVGEYLVVVEIENVRIYDAD